MRRSTATIVTLTALVVVACSKARTSGGGGGSVSDTTAATDDDGLSDDDGLAKTPGSPEATKRNPSAPVTPPEPVRAKVRNFEQFLYSMETISGIKASDATVVPSGTTPAVNHTVNSVYMGNKDNLPGSSKVAETAPVNVKAYADVAAIFARRMFTGTDAAATSARAAFLGADPTTAPDQYFTDEVLGTLIKQVWGGSVSQADMAAYVKILKDMIADLKTNLPAAEQTTVVGTRKLLVAAFAVLAASDMVL